MRSIVLAALQRRRAGGGGGPTEVTFSNAAAPNTTFEAAAPIQTAGWDAGSGANRYLLAFASTLGFGSHPVEGVVRHGGAGGTIVPPAHTGSDQESTSGLAFALPNPTSGSLQTWYDATTDSLLETISAASYDNVAARGPVVTFEKAVEATTAFIEIRVPTPNSGDRAVVYVYGYMYTGTPASAPAGTAVSRASGVDGAGLNIYAHRLVDQPRTGKFTTVRVDFSGVDTQYFMAALGVPLHFTRPYQILDTFDFTTKNTTMWESSTTYLGAMSFATAGGTTSQANGLLVLQPTDSANRVIGYSSNLMDMTGCYFQWRVAEASTIASELNFVVANPSDGVGGATQHAQWKIEREVGTGNLVMTASINTASATGTVYTAAWDPATHAYLRIRESGGDTFWETAPVVDGQPGVWTVRRRRSVDAGTPAAAFNMTSCKVGIFARNTGSLTGVNWKIDDVIVIDKANSYQVFDDFSINGVTTGGNTIRDLTQWDAVTRLPAWASSSVILGTVMQTSGELVITPTASADRIEGVSSQSQAITLVGQRLVGRITTPPATTASADIGYSDTSDTGQYIRWSVNNNLGTITIQALYGNNGNNGTAFSTAYNSGNHQWFSIRATGSDIFWETAPDAGGIPGTWTIQRQLTVDGGTPGVYFAPDAGSIGAYGHNWNSNATPITIGYGDVYVTPV